ncbi:MAG: sigma 54-interacting transcriptional regulator [candidate division Zixibacteria bacterium]|jgi:transcriptional regulator with PAS, ATPase and Fis domain|nr:sigma 54-interacting transcriptional regulator [candidate division Zixibacteria bacterium]
MPIDPKPKDAALQFLAAVPSQPFQHTLEMARKVAPFDTSILITGETGVGKEVIARYIHSASRRADYSMLSVNCGALPETLLESELFGHRAGSFTGAVRDRNGLFEQAARGTILLDEIGDISLSTQVKLLRVLQEREILRIGESIPRKVDTRIIAATNHNLEQAVTEGRFREDLLYRLRVIEIVVPPLRERPQDILPLTDYLVQKLSVRLSIPNLRLDDSCLKRFKAYHWPGNVRELENAIERAAVLSGTGEIKPEHLPPQLLDPGGPRQHVDSAPSRSLREIEMDYIKTVLKATGGHRGQAAKILGISPATLWRKLKNE